VRKRPTKPGTNACLPNEATTPPTPVSVKRPKSERPQAQASAAPRPFEEATQVFVLSLRLLSHKSAKFYAKPPAEKITLIHRRFRQIDLGPF
jgi:hypothetical protein